MPFLFPAMTALSSDVFLLWLGSRAPVESEFAEDHWVYHVSYLAVPLAVLRLLLLCLPLLFHSYTGTAVQHLRWYQVFYSATALVLAIHMLALALMDPESIEAIFPQVDLLTGNSGGGSIVLTRGARRVLRFLLQHLHELRRIWWMLLLSSVSVACHFILLWHVRSTAPNAYYSLDHSHNTRRSNKKQPTVYFAVRAASIQPQQQQQEEDEAPLIHAMNGTHIDTLVFVFYQQGQFLDLLFISHFSLSSRPLCCIFYDIRFTTYDP